MNEMRRWGAWFRLSNLPSAPGDALAGAALASVVLGTSVAPKTLVGVGVAALFLYVYGIVDNYIAGFSREWTIASLPLLPPGTFSLRTAKAARCVSWGMAFLVAALCELKSAWWLAAGGMLVAICAYNRLRYVWLMGLCRGLCFVAGGMAALGWGAMEPKMIRAFVAVFMAALGWFWYTAAVAELSKWKGEESEGLGNRRYLFGIAALVALPACILLPDARLVALSAAGCVFTFVGWCAAVAPLWCAHGLEERRMAVERATRAFLYMQIGFMLSIIR